MINFAARIVTGVKKHQHISPALNSLNWPSIESLVARRDAIKVWKALREEDAPPEIRALFVFRSTVSDRQTRASDQGCLHLRKYDLSASQKAFSYRAAAAFNKLPSSVRDSATLGIFKSALDKL